MSRKRIVYSRSYGGLHLCFDRDIHFTSTPTKSIILCKLNPVYFLSLLEFVKGVTMTMAQAIGEGHTMWHQKMDLA